MKKRYILPVITLICAFILSFLYSSSTNTIDVNIHDTYYVISNSSALYFVWLIYIPIALIYVALGKFTNITLGLFHLALQTLALILLLKTNQIDLQGLPHSYYTNIEEPWLNLPRLILIFFIGVGLFLSNILIGVVKAYKAR